MDVIGEPTTNTGEASGQEEQPGQRWAITTPEEGSDIIGSANITNFWTFLATAEAMERYIFAMQYHGILQRSVEAAQATAHKRGFNLVAGPSTTLATRALES